MSMLFPGSVVRRKVRELQTSIAQMQQRKANLDASIIVYRQQLDEAQGELRALQHTQRVLVLAVLDVPVFPVEGWPGWELLEDAGLFGREVATCWITGEVELSSADLVDLSKAHTALQVWRRGDNS